MKIRYAGHLWEASLADDGTLDTVIEICPVKAGFDSQTFRFTLEGNERHPNGVLKTTAFRELARECCELYHSDAI